MAQTPQASKIDHVLAGSPMLHVQSGIDVQRSADYGVEVQGAGGGEGVRNRGPS